MDEQTARFEEIFTRSQSNPQFRERVQQRINEDPEFSAGFQSHIQSRQQAQPAAPAEPQQQTTRQAIGDLLPDTQTVASSILSPGTAALSAIGQGARRPEQTTQALETLFPSQEDPQARRERGFLGNLGQDIVQSTIGSRGAVGLGRDIASSIRGATDIESASQRSQESTDRQLELINAIREQTDPERRQRLIDVLNQERQFGFEQRQSLGEQTEAIPSNLQFLGRLGNTAATVLSGGLATGARTAVLGRGLGSIGRGTLQALPSAVLGGAGDPLAQGRSTGQALIGAGLGAAATPLLLGGGRLFGRAIPGLGRATAQAQRVARRIEGAVTPRATGRARDAAIRERVQSRNVGNIFLQEDFVPLQEGQQRAVRLISEAPGESRTLPQLRDRTTGVINDLSGQTEEILRAVEVPVEQKGRVLERFNESADALLAEFSEGTQRRRNLDRAIESYRNLVDNASTAEDLLNARRSLDRELSAQVRGLFNQDQGTDAILEASRQLRREAADAIIDSTPSAQKANVQQLLSDQSELIQAQEEIVGSIRSRTRLDEFLRDSRTGRAIQSGGSAILGLGIGAAGGALGLGGFRAN